MKKRFLSLFLALSLCGGLSAPALAAEEQTFPDVPLSYWAYEDIETAAFNGWVVGVGDGTYAPAGNLDTASFATMLVRAFFPDELSGLIAGGYQSATWWDTFLETAYRTQILTSTTVGTDFLDSGRIWDEELLGKPMTRYDAVQMLYNVCRSKGITFETDGLTDNRDYLTEAFTDGEVLCAASAAYRQSAAACRSAGLINGRNEGEFAGDAGLTRAEAAAMVCRLYAFVNGEAPDSGAIYREEATDPAGVKSSVGKRDEHPTWGLLDVEKPNANGYYSGASVDIGNASLVYEFLDMVNSQRRNAGVPEVTWVESDAAEEYTLLWAKKIAANYYSERLLGVEARASGYASAQKAFDSWKSGSILTGDMEVYLSGARCGKAWTLILWTEDRISEVEAAAARNYAPAG